MTTSCTNAKPGGYMTVYLALTVTVIIALCLALIEGCRYRGISLETECVMDIGMDSILAEYHRELQKQYNLFVIDCSYGSENASTEQTERHLLEYMNRNFSLEDVFLEELLYRDFFAIRAEEAEITKAVFLTDEEGEVFRRIAVNAMEDTVGIGLMQQLTDWLQTIESRGLEQQDIAGEKQRIDEEILEYDGKQTAAGKILHIENPTAALEEKRNSGLLKLVMEEEEISSRRIEPETLWETRAERGEINHGNLTLEEPEIVKQGGRYGVKLRASAPSIHMIRADIQTAVSPIVGNEKQSEDMVNYLLQEFEGDTQKIWQSNIFGRSFHELVSEDLQGKLQRMPEDARKKFQETLSRIINEGSGGLICIIL